MFRFKYIILSIYFFTIFFALNSQDREYIESFFSDINIGPDAKVHITETITIISAGETIRHGIYRDIPTHYSQYAVDFTLKEVQYNGHPVEYTLGQAQNGERIRIGSSHQLLSPGRHVYKIAYVLDQVLGFFDDHDELFLNITGTGWPYLIKQISARIKLPNSIPASTIKARAYTGLLDQRGTDYSVKIGPDNTIYFATTRQLEAHENISVVVSWPKNYIKSAKKWGDIWLLLGLCLLSIFYINRWLKFRATQRIDTIIPLFYPPKDITPGAMRYLVKQKYDAQALAAQVVALAVHAFLAIKYQKKFLSRGTYTLVARKKPDNGPPDSQLIYNNLFKAQDSIELSSRESAIITDTNNKLSNYYSNNLGVRYLTIESEWVLYGILITIVFGSCMLFFTALRVSVIGFGALIISIILHVIAFYIFKGYTPEGLKLKEQIEGFKLFLVTSELEKLTIVGTPPTKTPHLFETYLPYAIALGVEKQWSKQFVPVFEKLAAENKAYMPLWYYGPDYAFRPLEVSHFSASFSQSISSVIIASSGYIPGSISGMGSSGSSGRGSGGGGGGGW